MSFERGEELVVVEDAQAILRECRRSECFELELPYNTASFLFDYFLKRRIEAGVLVWANGVRQESDGLGEDERLLIQVTDSLYAPGPSKSRADRRSLQFNYAQIQFLGRALLSTLEKGRLHPYMVDSLLQLREAASLAGADFGRGLSEAVDKWVNNQK